MTGAFLRIQRNGKWTDVDIDQLSDEELDDLAQSQPDDGWTWAKFLAAWIRDNVRNFDDQLKDNFSHALGHDKESETAKE